MVHRKVQACGNSQGETMFLYPYVSILLPLEDFYNMTREWGLQDVSASPHHSLPCQRKAHGKIGLQCGHSYFPKHHENFRAT